MKHHVPLPCLALVTALLLAGCAPGEPVADTETTPAETTAETAPADAPELVDLGPAPAWTLNGLDGKPVSLSDFAGKVVVLDFWATYCPPCIEEIPQYVELQREYADRGVVIVGLSADRISPMQVLNFTTKMGVNYPIVMLDGETADAYEINPLPTAFVLDRDGRIRYHKIGYGTKEDMERVIRALL